jgi:hypothetical protein
MRRWSAEITLDLRATMFGSRLDRASTAAYRGYATALVGANWVLASTPVAADGSYRLQVAVCAARKIRAGPG